MKACCRTDVGAASTYCPDICLQCAQAGSGSKAGSRQSQCRSLHFDKNPHRPSYHSLVQWTPVRSCRWVSLLEKGNKKEISELKWFVFMESSLDKSQEARVLVHWNLWLQAVILFGTQFPNVPMRPTFSYNSGSHLVKLAQLILYTILHAQIYFVL